MGATQQRSMSSQWSCPKRCGVWTTLCVYTWVHRTHACTNFASKVKANLYTYNQVETGHLHGCHSTEEDVITMELSQEVWCVDVVMRIYTWVHRTHAFTNCASKFVSTILASKSVYYFC